MRGKKKKAGNTFVSSAFLSSLLSDSNQRPEITNHVLWPTELKRRWVSLLYRAATTNYLCCDQALEDSKGAGRIGLTRFCFAVAKVDIFLKSAIACGDFFICFFRFSVLFLFMAFLYRHFGGEVRILSGITMDKYSFY